MELQHPLHRLHRRTFCEPESKCEMYTRETMFIEVGREDIRADRTGRSKCLGDQAVDSGTIPGLPMGGSLRGREGGRVGGWEGGREGGRGWRGNGAQMDSAVNNMGCIPGQMHGQGSTQVVPWL
jgi:hypothetical protein